MTTPYTCPEVGCSCLCRNTAASCLQVNGPAHTRWLTDALETSAVAVPVLGGIPKVRTPSRLYTRYLMALEES